MDYRETKRKAQQMIETMLKINDGARVRLSYIYLEVTQKTGLGKKVVNEYIDLLSKEGRADYNETEAWGISLKNREFEKEAEGVMAFEQL